MAEGGSEYSNDKHICSICLERFREPKLLPCFHTYCSACLSGHIQGTKRGNKFECPLCRQEIPVPTSGVNGFQTNFYIESSDATRGKTQSLTKTCNKHPKEELRLICKTCDQFACIICEKKFHRSHETELVSDEAETARENLRRCLDGREIKQHLTELKEMGQSTKFAKDLQRHTETIVTRIRTQKKKLMTAIEHIAAEEEAKVKCISSQYGKELTDDATQYNTELQSFESLLSTATHVLNEDDDFDIIQNGAALCSEVKKQTDKVITGRKRICAVQINFTEGQLDKAKLLEMLGEAVFSGGSKLTSDLLRCPLEIRNIKVKFHNKILFGCFEIPYNVSAVEKVAWISFGQECKLYDSTATMLQTICTEKNVSGMTANGSSSYFVSVDQSVLEISSGGSARTICSSSLLKPRGLTTCMDEGGNMNLLICYAEPGPLGESKNGQVDRCKYPGGDLTTFCSGLQAPVRVAAKERMELVAISDYRGSRVTIHNSKGRICAVYSGEGQTEFKPSGLCFDATGCIIVCNLKIGNVLRISYSGRLVQVLLTNKNVYSVALSNESLLWVGQREKDWKGKIEIFNVSY